MHISTLSNTGFLDTVGVKSEILFVAGMQSRGRLGEQVVAMPTGEKNLQAALTAPPTNLTAQISTPAAEVAANPSKPLSEADIDWLVALYEDNKEYARFHEEQREKTAQLIAVACFGVFSAIAVFQADYRTLPLSFLLLYLARFGRRLALKQFERLSRNTAIAHAIRREAQALLPAGGGAVERAYVLAEQLHSERMSQESHIAKFDILSFSLERHWLNLYKFIALLSFFGMAIGSASLVGLAVEHWATIKAFFIR